VVAALLVVGVGLGCWRGWFTHMKASDNYLADAAGGSGDRSDFAVQVAPEAIMQERAEGPEEDKLLTASVQSKLWRADGPLRCLTDSCLPGVLDQMDNKPPLPPDSPALLVPGTPDPSPHSSSPFGCPAQQAALAAEAAWEPPAMTTATVVVHCSTRGGRPPPLDPPAPPPPDSPCRLLPSSPPVASTA